MKVEKMDLGLNFTTIISSAISAAINAAAVYLSIHGLSKVMKNGKKKKDEEIN